MCYNPQNTIVTLTVNTDGITQDNVDTKVTFSDDHGDPAETPGDPKNYYSTVDQNYLITWKGVSVNKTDIINITGIVKKPDGGADVLGSIDPPIGSSETGQTVTAHVKTTKVAGDESYTVNFNINGGTPLSIDPRLRMH